MTIGNFIELGAIGGPIGGGKLELSPDARARHLYVPGSTGTGKSKFLEHLIQQDINAWGATQCGLLLLDWHGSLYDPLVAYLADGHFRSVPVVLIDFSQPELLVRYDPLRPRTIGDPAIIIEDLVAAILHGWGQSDTLSTPRLSKWLSAILMTLYENKLPLIDAARLISDRAMRNRLGSRAEHPATRLTWQMAAKGTEATFAEDVESTVSRLMTFVGRRSLRRMFGTNGPSLDFSTIIEEGSIVLVSLSSKGNQIGSESAKTIGSLMLSDLWASARARGKGEGYSPNKPFYVYLDEFQNYVNPVMGTALDQARGYGLHLTMAHQYPSQLLNSGEAGKAVYDSVLTNARTKVLFQLEHPADLDMLALMMFRGMMNPDEVKYQDWTTQTVGHEVIYLVGKSEGWTESGSDTVVDATAETDTEGRSSDESHSESTGYRRGSQGSQEPGLDELVTRSAGCASRYATSSSTARTTSQAIGKSYQHGISGGTTISPHVFPITERVKQTPIYRSISDQVFTAAQFIASQKDRHCLVRIVGNPIPISMRTEEVIPPLTMYKRAIEYAAERIRSLPFVGEDPPPANHSAPDDGGEPTISRRPIL